VSDVWANVAALDPGTQQRLAEVLETRGADGQQKAMRETFLGDVEFPADARVLEVGCGTGVLTRKLASQPAVGSVVGVDTAESLLGRASELAAHIDNVSFEVADARSLPFEDGSFDAVVFDSTLSHVPEPDRAVAEAFRVLGPEGLLAAFDGDYATTTVALGDHDPVQACVDAMMASSVTDRWLVRRLPALIERCGFELAASGATASRRSQGRVHAQRHRPRRRPAVREGRDQRRHGGSAQSRSPSVKTGTSFGHIAHASVVGRRAERDRPDRGAAPEWGNRSSPA
jgi:ubiquinone/menaquinone biosynthesis C-methylase UbiE